MKNFGKDKWLGIGILLFSVIVYAAIQRFQSPPMNITGDPGAKLFPAFGVLLMVIGGIGLILQKKQENKPFMQKDEYKRLLLLTAAFVVYAAGLWLVGFLAATVIMLWIVMGFMAGEQKLRQIIRILYSVLVTAVLYLVFTNVLHFKLPAGLVWSLF